ncbi:MAG: G8 domain-containing protein [Pseudomonadota bacterium]
MFDDWVGEVGEIEIAQRDGASWHRVDFAAPIENAVVVATASAAGTDPFTLAVRNVTDHGFELRLDEWDYLDGRHGAESVGWMAVSEGVHQLADGRQIQAGATSLATTGETRFASVSFRDGFENTPLVFGQLQSETDHAATDRVRAVSTEGFRAGLQLEQGAHAAEAATFGWIALDSAPGTAELVRGVTHAPTSVGFGVGEVLLAEMQTFHGADPATVHVNDAAATVAIVEERSADPETAHGRERVAVAAFPDGQLWSASDPLSANSAPVERWSDPATWGGRVPGPGEDVVIEAGRTILLDIDAEVAGLMIHGELIVEDQRDLTLSADWVMAMGGGDLTIGTAVAPYVHDFTLTLTGDPEDVVGWHTLHATHADEDGCPITGGTCKCALRDMADDQTAFLMAMGEGSTISIHAEDAAKTDWTRLAMTAEAGATRLTLEAATGWDVGDVIAIASTDFDAHQAEERVITAISPDGRSVTLDRPLAYMHFGEVQSYADGRLLDTRAEVALLSRNVTIQGDADSVVDGFGGHTMVMDGAEMRISGVEFTRMGQEGLMGRYAVHWHMIGDASDQYVTDSSFHHLFNRAVTVHGTQFARIEDTVAYDTLGHAYFLEDGSEFGNRFEGNLGFLTRAATAETALLGSDATHVATFWITNPANDFIGNVAAGSEHSGFWFAPGPSVTGVSAEMAAYADLVPATAALGRFEGNVGHSNAFANLAFDGHGDPATGDLIESDYLPEQTAVVRDFTSYKSADRAIWVRGGDIEFHDIRSADNARATFFSANQTMYDSLIVGRSANIGTPETEEERAQGRSLPDPFFGRYFRGHSIYDGPSGLIDTHFAGFGAEDAAFQTNGAAQKAPVHFVSGLSFEDVMPRGRVDFSPQAWDAHMWSSGILDLDGSLTGRAGATVTPILSGPDGESVFNTTDRAIRREAWGAWVLPDAELGLLRADSTVAPGTADIVTWSRSDGSRAEAGGTFDTYHQTSVALNSALTYRLEYDTLPPDLTLSLRFAGRGDAVVVEIPNLPSEAVIGGAVHVDDRAALAEQTRTAFTREGTMLVVRLVADALDPDGRAHPSASIPAAAEHRFVAGITIHNGAAQAPVVADFEAADPRVATFANSALVSEPSLGLQDQDDSILFWDVTADGDRAPGQGTMRLDLDGQDWSGADAVSIRAALDSLGGGATGVEVLIRDRDQGVTSLGRIQGTAELNLSGVAEDRRDQIDSLLFRASATGAEGTGQRVHLFDVSLEPAALEARPLHLGNIVDAGAEFGIVSAAITSAVRSSGPLTVVAVSDAVGGSVRTGVPGQGDNVFFQTGPEATGIAQFTATVRDGSGAEVQVPVRFEVADIK